MKITHNQVSWEHIANPNLSDLEFLNNEYFVSGALLNELLNVNQRPKIEEHSRFLFIVLHFPVFNSTTRQTKPVELDFVIAKDAVFTITQDQNPALENLFNELIKDERLKEEVFKNAGQLLFYILDKMVDSCLPMLDHISENIEEIEKHVFEGKEKEMLKEVAIVKRDIIDFRRAIKPQRSVLEVLAKKASRFFKEDLDIICQEVIGSEVRVWNTLENHKEMIEAIEQTNSNLLAFQLTEVMHTLTFFSIVLFSLTFIAGFFSMHATRDLAIVNLGFIALVMLAVVLLIAIIFKKKKWL